MQLDGRRSLRSLQTRIRSSEYFTQNRNFSEKTRSGHEFVAGFAFVGSWVRAIPVGIEYLKRRMGDGSL
ncbi:hypothetical protein TNCV_303021 [Trichonephila clavipes]|nr:hypothetical protein TNCV_303021 [Trichonephila clavipes]